MKNMDTVKVYSEKEQKFVDIEIINKDERSYSVACVMLVVDEEE